jgi:hypothetical protein
VEKRPQQAEFRFANARAFDPSGQFARRQAAVGDAATDLIDAGRRR